MSTVAERPMTKRNDTAVKIDAEVIRRAKIVAAYRSQSLAEYLTSRLAPFVDADLAEEQEKQSLPQTKPKPPRR